MSCHLSNCMAGNLCKAPENVLCPAVIVSPVIMGKTFEEHLHHLQQVLDRLKSAGLKIQPSKCHFLQHEVNFLGHIVLSRGVSPDPSKTVKVKEWPTPTSTQEVQQFLGLASYYRHFIQNFAMISKPLHQATEKKNPFRWTEQCEKAFTHLKSCLTSAPILALPDWIRPFILDTDASETSIGAVLSQYHPDMTEYVIAYASRLLTKPERNYCVTHKELLAVVTFLNHFRHYLIGRPFTIQTDHGALTWLQNFKLPECQLARWLEKLQDYQFTIIHRPGRKHSNADTLSRIPCQQCGKSETITIASITSTNLSDGHSSEDIRRMQLNDNIVGSLLQAKETNQKPLADHAKCQGLEYRRLYQQWNQLVAQEGVLWRYYAQPREQQGWLQLVVPRNLRPSILEELHQGVGSGHLGHDKP